MQLDVRLLLLFGVAFQPTDRKYSCTAAPYDFMVTDGRVHDIDKDDWDRWYVHPNPIFGASSIVKQVRIYLLPRPIPNRLRAGVAEHDHGHRTANRTIHRP